MTVALILHERHKPNPNPRPTPEPGPTDNSVLINRELRRAAIDIELAQAKQALRHLESVQAEWSKLLDATFNDVAGKRIAGNEELLLRFIALRRMPSPMTSAEFTNQLNSIAQELQAQAIDGRTLDRLTSNVTETKQRTFVASEFHQARADYLHVLRESAASLPAGDVELSAAISIRDSVLTNNVHSAAVAATQGVESSLDNELKQLKKDRDDAASLVAHLKMDLARAEKGESLNTPPADEVSTLLAARQDYEKELERIRTDLVAFTTPGYVQPESADKLVYHQTKQPVSYSALQRIGALEDSEKGRAILLRVGGSKSATQQNDRPLGNFPRMNSISELRKPAIATRVREAQRLLRTYGLLMVKDGLLSP